RIDAGAFPAVLIQRDAADGGLGLILDLRLGRGIGLEEAADESALLGEDLLHLVVAGGVPRVLVAERLGAIEDRLVHLAELAAGPVGADLLELDDRLVAAEAVF